MKISVAADHGGYMLKNAIAKYLTEKGHTVVDHGTNTADSVNYPDYAHPVCVDIQKGESELGILVCGTGIGMSLAANKHKGIRAACCSDTFSARLTRMHNDSNILCIGERVVGYGLALDLVDNFVNTAFEGGRHTERVKMVMAFEDEQ